MVQDCGLSLGDAPPPELMIDPDCQILVNPKSDTFTSQYFHPIWKVLINKL